MFCIIVMVAVYLDSQVQQSSKLYADVFRCEMLTQSIFTITELVIDSLDMC